MSWLYNSQLSIAHHGIYYREIIGNVLGLISAIGGMRRQVWAWPIGIVGNVFLFTVFLGNAFGHGSHAPLIGQAGRQVFFAVTSIYGWYRWSHAKRANASAPAVSPRWATWRERAAYLSLAVVGVVVCDIAFHLIGEGFEAQWWYYLADAWIFVGSMVATFAMARGWVDFWLCWIAVDLVGVPELIHAQYYPSATLYAIYAGFVVWGFFVWRRIARDEPYESPLTPVQEAVG